MGWRPNSKDGDGIGFQSGGRKGSQGFTKDLRIESMGEVEDVAIVVDNDGDDDNKDSIEDDYEHVDEDEEFGINGENDYTMYCPPSHVHESSQGDRLGETNNGKNMFHINNDLSWYESIDDDNKVEYSFTSGSG